MSAHFLNFAHTERGKESTMTRAFCAFGLCMFTSYRCQKLTSERYVSHEISLVKVILAKASPIERTFGVY